MGLVEFDLEICAQMRGLHVDSLHVIECGHVAKTPGLLGALLIPGGWAAGQSATGTGIESCLVTGRVSVLSTKNADRSLAGCGRDRSAS